MPNNLPAPRPETAPPPAVVRHDVAREAAGLWAAKWSTIEKLNADDLAKVATIVLSSFPDMGALEVVNYFDLLGGRLRPNAEFWIHVAARHPATQAGPLLEELVPGSDDWIRFLGRSLEPELVAAAYKAIVLRTDRTAPVEEANYVLRADPMLWEYEYLDDLPAQNRPQAEAIARERLPTGAELDRVWFKNGWRARVRTLKPDWEPLARKKCRTTAARRVCTKAYSLSEAKVLSTLHEAQRVLEAVRAGRGTGVAERPAAVSSPSGRRELPAGRVEVGDVRDLPDDAPAPYAEAVEPSASAEASAAVAAPAGPRAEGFLAERDRRRLFAWAAERQLGEGEPLELLKRVLAAALRIPLSEVSSKRVPYSALPRIQAVLESYPPRDAARPPLECVCTTCGAVARAWPGAVCLACLEGRLTLIGDAAEPPVAPAPAQKPPEASPAAPAAPSAPIAAAPEASPPSRPAAPVGPLGAPPEPPPATLPVTVRGVPAGTRLDALVDGLLVEIREELTTRGRHGDVVEQITELLEARRFEKELGEDGLPW